MIFRAIWPIVDDRQSLATLRRQAARELPVVAARAHAVILSPGRWSVVPSDRVAGSGRVTESVLMYEAPAAAARRDRPYLRRAS